MTHKKQNIINNKLFYRLYCIEILLFILLCLFVAFEYSRYEKLSVSLSDWTSRNIDYVNNAYFIDENICKTDDVIDVLWGPYIELSKGKYNVEVCYECEVEQYCLPFANNDNINYLQAKKILLSKDQTSVQFQFGLIENIDNFELVFKYNGQGSFTIKNVEIYPSPRVSVKTCILCFVIFALLDFVYVIYKKLSQNNKFIESAAVQNFIFKITDLWQDKRSLKKRMSQTIICVGTFCFTFILFGPCEIYIQNIDDFSFDFFDLIVPMSILALLMFACLVVLLSLLHGKIFNYTFNILFVITLAGYIQGFINIDHGSFTGDAIDWVTYKWPMISNSIFWLLVLVCSLIVMYISYKAWQNGVKFICTIIVFAQTIALISLFIGTNLTPKADMYISTEDMFEVAEDNNVVVFLLDRLDNIYTDELLKKYPEWNDKLSDFTYYHNFTGSYANTRPSIAYFFTGVKHDYTVPWSDYFAKVWSAPQLPMLTDIHNAGYRTGIYDTDYALGNAVNYANIIDNVVSEKLIVDYKALIGQMLDLSAYRYSPEMLKPYYRLSNLVEIVSSEPDSGNNLYVEDDPEFWSGYKERGLTVNSKAKGAFIFYHLMGAHPPYTMNEQAERVSESSDSLARNAQIAGNMNMIFQYIDELKEKGVYDETTIIITTDHARSPGTKGDISDVSGSRVLTLMIKPAGANTNVPMQISNKQICQDNLRASIIGYFGLDTTKYGRSIESIGENEMTTRYVWIRGERGEVIDKMHTFEIVGDANNFANWNLISVDIMKETSL